MDSDTSLGTTLVDTLKRSSLHRQGGEPESDEESDEEARPSPNAAAAKPASPNALRVGDEVTRPYVYIYICQRATVQGL